MKEVFKEGDIVYRTDPFGGIIKSKLIRFYDYERCRVEDEYFVDRKGEIVSKIHAMADLPTKSLCATAEEAYVEGLRKKGDATIDYKEQITNLKDLVAFPLWHDVHANGEDNERAKEAYVERAYEITGVYPE